MSRLVHTHIARVFAAEVGVRDGKPAVVMKSPTYYQHFLNTECKVGDLVSVTITSKRPKRTVQQNSYYWGVYLPAIAKETGEYDLERLHTLFKGKFLTKEIVEVMGQKVRITKSTTELSVTAFSEYIMSIEELTGVAAPPVESFELAPLRR